MALTHSSAVRSDLAAKILSDIDAQSNAGKLKVRDSGNVILVTLLLGSTPGTKPSGAVSGAVLTFSAVTTVNCSTAGTAANFIITDGSDTTIFTGTVSSTLAGTGDLQFSNTSFAVGDPISITSLAYTAPV